MDLPLDKKTVENQDWASGPQGHRAVAGHGPLATGPSGRRAAGRWAAGLLLAKLMSSGVYIPFLCIFKKILCTWIGLYTDRSELKSCIVRDSATKLLFIGANFV